MPPLVPRRPLAAAIMLALALVTAGCEPPLQGPVRVAVIGDAPAIADPASGPLSPGEAVVLQNAAQGLVRFDPRGQIEPGLAERWNVSDDGLSYIFRLKSGEWPNGRRIGARHVARLLRRQLARSSGNSLKDSLGSAAEIVAMTDRVLEIRLGAPRPELLQLLAQPEFAILHEETGTGPFAIEDGQGGELRFRRDIVDPDGEEQGREELVISGMTATAAVDAFVKRQLDLVLGGTFADLPHARAARLPRGSLIFDPVAGLFGLVPARSTGPAADREFRALLSQAIDREALIAALDVPGLAGRATLLESGLDGVPEPVQPAWLAAPIGDRRPDLIAAADRLLGDDERPTIRIDLPEGPGADLLLRRLAEDWQLLGIRVERSVRGDAADFRLVDAVAPATSAAWFLRRFRCQERPVCSEEADALLDAARAAPVAAQRAAFLAESARLLDEAHAFLAIAAPVRWSLVSSRIEGFAGNRLGRHTLTRLEEKLAASESSN